MVSINPPDHLASLNAFLLEVTLKANGGGRRDFVEDISTVLDNHCVALACVSIGYNGERESERERERREREKKFSRDECL